MNSYQTNLIKAMQKNIFKNVNIDPKIISEVPFFRNVLIENINNHEIFHGYVNKINEVWYNILLDDFKILIIMYNKKYQETRQKEFNRQQEMIRMATDMATKEMLGDLGGFEISPSISSLTKGIKKTGISKKGPTKKRLKK